MSDLRLFVRVVDAIRSNTWKASVTLADMRFHLEGEHPSGAITDEFLREACAVAGVTFHTEPESIVLPVPIIPDIAVLRAMEDLLAEVRSLSAEVRSQSVVLVEYRKLIREERDTNRKFMVELNQKMEIFRPVKPVITEGQLAGLPTPV